MHINVNIGVILFKACDKSSIEMPKLLGVSEQVELAAGASTMVG